MEERLGRPRRQRVDLLGRKVRLRYAPEGTLTGPRRRRSLGIQEPARLLAQSGEQDHRAVQRGRSWSPSLFQALEGTHRPAVHEDGRGLVGVHVEGVVVRRRRRQGRQPQGVRDGVSPRPRGSDGCQDLRERGRGAVDTHVGAAGDLTQSTEGFVERRCGRLGHVLDEDALVPPGLRLVHNTSRGSAITFKLSVFLTGRAPGRTLAGACSRNAGSAAPRPSRAAREGTPRR